MKIIGWITIFMLCMVLVQVVFRLAITIYAGKFGVDEAVLVAFGIFVVFGIRVVYKALIIRNAIVKKS